MDCKSLRCSSIMAWQDCQFKWYLHNNCGIESVAGKKANLGTCVHQVLELMAKAKKIGRHTKPSKFNDPKYLLDIAWNQMVKNNPDDYTHEDYDFCWQQISNVLESQFHPFKLNIIDVEKQFELRIERDGFDGLLFRGTVDLVTQPDPNDNTIIELCDYKTGQRTSWTTGEVKEYEDLQDDIQLRGYNLAIRYIYKPTEVVLFSINFTRDGGVFTVPFGAAEAEETLEEIRRVYNEIITTDVPKRLIDDKRRSREFFKCKYVCQFGMNGEVEYTNGEDTLFVEMKISKPKEIPQVIEFEEKEYFFVGIKQSLCKKYHNLMRKHTPVLAIPHIQDLTVKGQPVSARNDYNAAGIHKGVIS